MRIALLDYNFDNYYPISQTRPVWDLFTGMKTPRERIGEFPGSYISGSGILYQVRDELLSFVSARYPDLNVVSRIPGGESCLLLSPFVGDLSEIDPDKMNCLYTCDGEFYGALVSAEFIEEQGGDVDSLVGGLSCIQELDIPAFPRYIWDLVTSNGSTITADFRNLPEVEGQYSPAEQVSIVGSRADLIIEEDVRIDPCVVIDTTGGPVYISRGSEIHPFTRIEGPCYIGEDAVLLGAKVREGCSIGAGCRIGGEVEDSIFYPYANKYHDGFIGHACIGSWVNLGALTTNSDLKNDYSTVSVYTPGGYVDSGECKVGCFIGDHSKCSIGTLINTGTVLGPFSMTVQSGMMARKHIPPFSMFIKNSIRPGACIDDIIKTAETVMSRRNISLDSEFREYISFLYEKTQQP